MNIALYDPWRTMRQWQNEMERVLGSPRTVDDDANVVGAEWIPAVDIREDDDGYVLHADIPGVNPEDIEVSMEQGILTIKGERESETTEEKGNFKRVERAHGLFYRRFSLPENTDPERIEAHSENGVLKITIPKVEAHQPRKIEVKN